MSSLRVPGDKSIAHRAIILAALARGRSRLRGVPDGLDVQSTQRAMELLGATLRSDGDGLVVEGCAGAFTAPRDAIDCGNSGTTMRLLTGLLATRPLTVKLTGDASLRARPMRRIAVPLAAFGAQITLTPEGQSAADRSRQRRGAGRRRRGDRSRARRSRPRCCWRRSARMAALGSAERWRRATTPSACWGCSA
jgi:5-enolpyruvylshikimate-3-phosphate synthase